MPGTFDGVEVVLGPRCGDWYPVVKGLEAGQRVAVSGAFLLDAETRLNPSLASSYFRIGQPSGTSRRNQNHDRCDHHLLDPPPGLRHRACCVLAVLGIWAAWRTPVDAIPDLSENQVIVFTDWKGHAPREIEDQVTYP